MSDIKIYGRPPYCQKVLPLTYEESLSYYETLCQLVHKLNEVISEVNSIDPDNILSQINKNVQDQIDAYMKDVTKQLDNLSSQVGTVMDNVDSALTLYHNQITLELQNTTANLTDFVNNQLSQIKHYIDYQDNAIYQEIWYQINLLKNSLPDLTTVYVRSPYSGKIVDIQTAINELWEYMRVNSLTAYEYDSLKLTAEEYDNYELTAYTYDYFARRYIWKDPSYYMFNPWTGEWETIQSTIRLLETIIKQQNLSTTYPVLSNHAITAQEYDDLKLTAFRYDNYQIRAQRYDWNASQIPPMEHSA